MQILVFALVYLQIENAILQQEPEEIVDLRLCKPENRICQRFQCAPMLQCPKDSKIVEGGSRCGCCPICQKILGDGEDCPKENPFIKSTTICSIDTPCAEDGDDAGKCKKKDPNDVPSDSQEPLVKTPLGTRCTRSKRKRQEALDLERESQKPVDSQEPPPPPLPKYFPFRLRKLHDLWEPECDAEGLYLPKQCKHKKCMCVDAVSGDRIYGQAEIELAANMTCACAVALNKRKLQDELSWQTYVQEHCTTSGDYEDLQCVEDTCFCADPASGKPLGPMVKIKQRELLPCYESKLHKESYMTTCEKEAITQRRLLYDFAMKGISIKGLQGIRCDLDGNFFYRHCSPDTCYCTDRGGISFGVYKKDRNSGSIEDLMNCRCARDEEDNTRNHARYENLKCDQLGNFASFQCLDNLCFCVDMDGDRITNLVKDIDLKDMNMNDLCTFARNALALEEDLEKPKIGSDEDIEEFDFLYQNSPPHQNYSKHHTDRFNTTSLRIQIKNITNNVKVGHYV